MYKRITAAVDGRRFGPASYGGAAIQKCIGCLSLHERNAMMTDYELLMIVLTVIIIVITALK